MDWYDYIAIQEEPFILIRSDKLSEAIDDDCN